MAQFTSCNDMQPKKVFLGPPGLAAPSHFAAPQGLGPPGPPGLAASCWQAPHGFDAPAQICACGFSSAESDCHSSVYLPESQRWHWNHSWQFSDQDSWDELYETCTLVALGCVKNNSQGRCKPLCRTHSYSDVSVETDSTADTLHGTEQEMMVQEEVIDSLSKALLVGGEDQQNALECIIDQLPTMCKTQQGSLLVQSAVALVTGSHLDALVVKLSGCLIDACKSPHGNHVVQKCIDAFGPQKAQFIIDALKGKAVAMARDRFACRIMQHLVDVCPEEQIRKLVDEMMEDATRLCRHPFANYVMQSVVKEGTPARRVQMANVLLADAPGFSRHRFAKHVLQLAIVHCEPAKQAHLLVASKRPRDFFIK